MYILVHKTPADNMHIYRAFNVQNLWQQIKDEIYADPADADDFEELRALHYNQTDWEDYNPFFGELKVQSFEENLDEDLHGHIVCVRPSDLAAWFNEDEMQYITEDMLIDIAETIVESDSEHWDSLFNEYLEATMIDNAGHWQAMILREKMRREGL